MRCRTPICSTFAMVVLPMTMLAHLAAASPITVVPWNGHQGAVSFTFDDGLGSQITNVVPALKQRNIHATFFIPGFGTGSSWIQVAKDGNEIANHTADHVDLTNLVADSVASEITRQSNVLRNLDPAITAQTLAYPYCATNDAVDAVANRYDLIARTCGGSTVPWGTEPNWMSMPALYIPDGSAVPGALSTIDDAANGNLWLVTLNHGVGGDYLSVDPSQVDSMFDKAIADKLWIDTYLNIAAYFRASFAMAQSNTVKTDSGWTVSWTSPHPKMPTSVPLRISLDAGTFGKDIFVYQMGNIVPAQADGSYVIEFMDLSMVVRNAPVITVPAHRDTVFNGGFGLGTVGWTFNVWGGGAHGSVVNGEYKIQIDSIGQHNSSIQLVQNGIILEKGKSYQVKFDAYSSAKRTLEANVEQDVNPWTSYLPALQNFDLTTTKTTYSYTFAMTNPTDSNGRVSFNVGASTESVFLDNISIKPIPVGVRTKGETLAKGLRWSAGTLLLPVTESGKWQIVDSHGRGRIVDVTDGRGYTGQLPKGVYQARYLDGKTNGIQTFMALP